MNKIDQAIDNIPGEEGWYKSSSKEIFLELIEELIDRGFSLEDAKKFLTTAYHAIAGEYGD